MGVPETARRVAVLGAGTMGRGIAAVFAHAGCQVVLQARSLDRADEARTWAIAHGGADAGSLSVTDSDEAAVHGACLVCETIVEDLDAKQGLLARIEPLLDGGCLVTTNTSSLPITRLASVLHDPGRLIGMHWFNPATVMPVVELVRGEQTRDDVVAHAQAWCRRAGKETIVVRSDLPGFVVNRLQYAMFREAVHLVKAGIATAADVDRAVATTLAPRWSACGPLELMDLAGLDTVRYVSEILMGDLDASPGVPELVRTACEQGRLGARSGAGFYDWNPERVARAEALRDRMVVETAALRKELGR